MHAVSIDRVSKTFDRKRAVIDLSLDVPQGSLFGLIGPNGAGKTTTLRMILNIYAPDTGTIRVLGSPVSEEMKSKVGYLPEERGLYMRMLVGDVLVFAAGIKGVPASRARKAAKEWLDRMGLGDCWGKKVQDLSKGMQQKVQFISTVLHEPDLLILDEPFSGLDPLNTNALRDIMLEERKKGRTIIFSTHMMEQVERLCDRVCMINGGRKVLDGTVAEVRGSTGRKVVALRFEGDGALLEASPHVLRTSAAPGRVEVTLADGADTQALLADVASKVRLSMFEIVEPSMHDIFVERVESADEPESGTDPVVVTAGAPAR
jgi:ABC-2 type transport system ATP-binding protein